jgi:hypothetical protein
MLPGLAHRKSINLDQLQDHGYTRLAACSRRLVSTPIAKPLKSLVDVFSEVKDPRVARTRLHPIENVLAIALLGAIAGADGWEEHAGTHSYLRVEKLAKFSDIWQG